MKRSERIQCVLWVVFIWGLAPNLFCQAATPADPFNDSPLASTATPVARFDFDFMPIGAVPSGLETLILNGHGLELWTVQGDARNPTKPHTFVYGNAKEASPSEPGDLSFDDDKALGDQRPWAAALIQSSVLAAGDVTAAYKLSGGADARAGFIYRYQDPSAFYLLESDAGGEFFTLYRVQKGKWKVVNRISGVVTPDVWHTLRLIFQNDVYEVYFDNELVIGGHDKGLLSAGRVGLAVATDAGAAFNHVVLRSPAVVVLPAARPSH